MEIVSRRRQVITQKTIQIIIPAIITIPSIITLKTIIQMPITIQMLTPIAKFLTIETPIENVFHAHTDMYLTAMVSVVKFPITVELGIKWVIVLHAIKVIV